MSEKYSLTIRPPREAGAATVIDLKPSMIQRLRGAYQVFSGQVPDWFGPGAPLPAQAPPEIAGREFDFPTAYNLNQQPKYAEGVNFKSLQTLSYSWDLLRAVIETRKDQVCQMEWNISPRDPTKKTTPQCKTIKDWFQLPDQENTWEQWLRILLEDLLVLDAPTLYPRIANDGSLYALEPVDGSTIKRVIDDMGRTPVVPYIAYQQVLKGMPATSYTRDGLIYRPRNKRASMVYGYSQVEQIMITIQLALNRQASLLQYYTDGSTPDLILSVPSTWGPDQIKQFKIWWDSVLKGNVGAKRGTMFVFDGTKAINTKDKLMDGKNKIDEWLARVLCFAFSMSPQPFIDQLSRGGAVQATTQAKEEGLEPIMAWVRNLMNFLLAKYFDAPDLEFKWTRDMETDPLTRAQINNLKLRAGAMTLNEWRALDGEDPIDGGDVPMIYTATGAVPLDMIEETAQAMIAPDPAQNNPDGAKPNGAANAKPNRNAKGKPGGRVTDKPPSQTRTANDRSGPRGAGKSVNKAVSNDIGRGRPVTKVEQILAKELTLVLRKMSAQALSALAMHIGRLDGGMPPQDVDVVLAGLKIGAGGMAAPMAKALTAQIMNGHKAALQQILQKAVEPPPIAEADASAYAAARSASMVTEIEETTRAMLRNTVAEALEKGWSLRELAEVLMEEYAFSASRAATIAATEMNDALTHAELSAWESSGVVKSVEWSMSNLEGVCTVCEANADEGPVEIGTLFSSGDDGPPAHPNCRCSLIPVVEL